MKASILMLPLALIGAGCASSGTATFATPEEAVQRLVAAADDESAAEDLLGPGGFELLRSGDEVADQADLEAVVALVREGLAFEDLDEDAKLALLGHERWELPIPLVREDGGWRFDVEAGREEILNRRVGRNELSTIATLHALVEAQHEYARARRDDLPVGETPAFARRLLSSPGERDGLYWPVEEGEEPSPLGPLVAEAAEEGYGEGNTRPTPYHGYFYRLLTEQGEHAPGGARGYVDAKGRLTGGFAVVAWPANHDNSGVMTFLVDQRGIVFQKDLGEETAEAVAGIRAYDPDPSWSPVAE